MYPITFVQQSGIIVLGASGAPDSIKSFPVVRSNQPFTNLSITVRPVIATAYTVEVLHDGEPAETHTYPGGNRTIAEMSYPDFIFPANRGTDAIPQFVTKGFAPQGIDIYVRLTNNDVDVRSFEVSTCYAVSENCRFELLPQQ